MTDTPRLIEHAFPLKQTSLDSVHEKNVRHGHISTLHIWPARRPLAACRAALIATLLPDPSAQPKPEGMSDEDWYQEIIRQRQELCEKIGGKVIKKIEKKKMPNGQIVEREKEVTEGGILHWGRETENKETMEWFQQEIRKAYGGRAPKVLDPFAGGGAIPLEAMRLGCEATAMDINPVAWFILKCTLEYPQKLAGKNHPLPDFIFKDEDFMRDFFTKAKGFGKAETTKALGQLGRRLKGGEQHPLNFADNVEVDINADIAWHVRAWGRWVLDHARRELARFYPTYADFEPIEKNIPKPCEKQPMQLVPLREDGTADIGALNAEFGEEYLKVKSNLRWVAKPTVAYLWARTVTCKNCRSVVPLLKTRWLCKKEKKRVLLTMEPNTDKTGMIFGVDINVSIKGGNPAQRREHDKRIGIGTMSKSGTKCPCCGLPSMTMEDIRIESIAGRSNYQLTSVVVEGLKSKEYRSATENEIALAEKAASQVEEALTYLPNATITGPFAPCSTRSISAQLYGVRRWCDLYTPRQMLAIAQFGKAIHEAYALMQRTEYEAHWLNAITDYLCLGLDRLVSFLCVNARWKSDADSLTDAFSRFSISLLWDFAEAQPLGTTVGSYIRCNDRIATALDGLLSGANVEETPHVVKGSAVEGLSSVKFDTIITDPPYYEAVSYADLSDFSYSWLRGFRPALPMEFEERFADKTKEVVQHIREDKNREEERLKYEHLMAEAFARARESLAVGGRFVCVFAHKNPTAWETLVSAIIRAGFVVTCSWPIQTEMPSRQRASSASSLASSVWLVCKQRPFIARPGWDNQVLEDMRRNIRVKLREFWDAGIRGPDFVWAATGPALEAYSKHPIVKKANEPGPLTVSEFLTHVRRMVVDFVVGRVLSGNGFAAYGDDLDETGRDRLDEPTAYYLLHRHDFGMDEAPAGACILYAISCGVSDKELADTWDLIGFTKGKSAEEPEDEEANADAEIDPEADEESGSKVKLKTWAQRKGRSLGFEAPGGRPVPLIDRVHCLMHLWKSGDLYKLDEYLDDNGLRRQELFKRLLQSLIELSPAGSEERSLLESLSNHIQARGTLKDDKQRGLTFKGDDYKEE